jgi:hypothetical protein
MAERDKDGKDGGRLSDEELWDRIIAEIRKFDVYAIEDETHLRSLIMSRVTESAIRMITVLANGKHVCLIDLPENERLEKLNEIMADVMSSSEGQGPVLRRHILKLILDYRTLMRLRERMRTLGPGTRNHKKTEKGIRHLEEMLASGMFLLYTWPMRSEDGSGI